MKHVLSALVASVAVLFQVQQLRAAPIPPCETSVPSTIFFNLREGPTEDPSDQDSTCMILTLPGVTVGTGAVAITESSNFNPSGDPSEWSDILLFSTDGLNSFVRLVSDGAAAFPRTRNALNVGCGDVPCRKSDRRPHRV
jgi:hypothetical protein